MNSNEWFASWFDTSYYHLLYKKRNLDEAKVFIQNLLDKINLSSNSNVLDLACGKGRHSKTLNDAGLNVLGVDLSEQSIESAKLLENETLHFKVHDMRKSIEGQRFDAIFNLFTSFGYFPNDEDNLHVLRIVHGMLRLNGWFVFDFLNANYVIKNLVPIEDKTLDGIHFCIERSYDGQFIRKSIDIDDHGKLFHFEEKVRGYSHEDLNRLLEQADFQVIDRFGSFDLKPFDEMTSERSIFICKRKTDL
ncbi:MAG: methyltransferase domain-containing protein [Bacteroidetes bacterium]|nr:methyltransferase domain-containing protein [Bacteroidota bacterium]